MTDDSERWTDEELAGAVERLAEGYGNEYLSDRKRVMKARAAASRLRGGEGEREEPPYCLDCGHPTAYHRRGHCAATMVGEDGEENPCGCESDRHFLGRDALSPTDGEEGAECTCEYDSVKGIAGVQNCPVHGQSPAAPDTEGREEHECPGGRACTAGRPPHDGPCNVVPRDARPEEAGGEDTFDPRELSDGVLACKLKEYAQGSASPLIHEAADRLHELVQGLRRPPEGAGESEYPLDFRLKMMAASGRLSDSQKQLLRDASRAIERLRTGREERDDE